MTTASNNVARDFKARAGESPLDTAVRFSKNYGRHPDEQGTKRLALALAGRVDTLPERFGRAFDTLNRISPPKPAAAPDHRAEFLADFHAKADMVLPVRDGIPPHADTDVDLRAVLDEQAADLRRTRLKCDCCPDCGEPLTELEQAFDSLGHEIHGKQTRECSDACGWDGEERNTPARAWR